MRERAKRGNPAGRLARDRRSAAMLETALCLPVFLLLLLGIFELALDSFITVTLESTLQDTSVQMEVGATSTATATNFVTNNVCPNALGLLNCNNLYIRVQTYSPTSCSDFHAATTGQPPASNGAAELSDFIGTSAGAGGNAGPTACSTSGTTPFCDPLPQQQIILTAVYLGPSFLQGLIPGLTVSYNGASYHMAYDTIAFETENFSLTTAEPAPCPASA